MAHLFLASKMASPDDHSKTIIPRMPVKSAMKPPSSSSLQPSAAAAGKDASLSSSPSTTVLFNEAGLAAAGLAAATGGAEASCYRCVVPFGVVVLIAGAVVTAVAYAFNAHGSTISVLGLAVLSAGLALLASSALCWRLRSRRRRRRQQRDSRRESQTALIADA